MRLKSLETYGFKSFADKFKLDFSDGVTCIVGPNGCGKSNVSDAIRWVLGEQNSKELRVGKGNKMEQVIFKGTEGKYGRSPMTYCEVVLTFDNTDRTLNIDTDEVSISRKMFKTGISEYCINGKKEKLKLIVDLFRNTGIGKDGYSVIGQGKIDNLLFAKPDELRLTFEEAAGISKLRQNRKDSLNKLEEASNDLNVVEEKLHVLENVIEPLKKQAETAQKAAVFKAKIKQLDINHFIYLTDSSVEQINKHEEKLKKINEKLANIEIEKSEVKTEYDQKQDRIKAIDVEYTEAYESLLKLTKDLGLQSTKQKELEKDIADGKNSNEEKQNKINTLSADATNKTKTVEEKNELMQEKIKDGLIAQNDLANLKQEFNTVSSDLKAKREKYDLTNNLILQNVQNSASITSDVATLNTEILLLEKNINDNKETIKNNNSKKKDEEKLMNEASLKYDETEERKNKYKTEKEEIQKQYFNKLETKQVAEVNNSRLVQEISKLVGLINYKTDMLNSFGGFDYGVRQLMNEKDPAVKSRVYGVIGRLISVKPEYALAIETALGGNINNIVTESYADANFLIDYLKNTSGGGRATFMPLSEIVPKELEEMYDDVFDEPGVVGLCADLVRVENKYRKAIDSLLGKVVAVTTKEVAAQIAKKYRKGFRIVTLDGENFAVTGFVTGGKASGKGDSVLTLEAEINKNREELEKNKKEKELIDKELNLINGELKKLEESARSNDEIVSKIDKELLSHKNDIDNHQKEIDRLDKENNKLDEQNKNIDQDKTDKSILLEAAKQKMGNQNTEKSDANSLLKQMSDDINVLETKQSELQNSISLKVDQVNKIESDIKLIKQEIFNIEKSISSIQEEMTSLTAQIVIKEGEINTKEKELKELIDKAIKNEALADKRVVLDDLDKEKKELAEIVDNIYQKLLKLSEQVTTESENKARVETQLDNLKKEINDTTSKIAEDYELDYDAALEYKLEEYDDKDGQNEMKSLKRQLTSLGEINEKAIEDLEIKNKEYNDTKIQYDDCVNSKASILETIRSLTANMEQKFKASFDIIRDNFTKVFNDMFDGGHGDIKIAYKDGVSILDCGVIIEADPPGKKLHNIELLSGGERSLTAIALVFAIQGLNPAPFCVLDEVDSALDDSNAVVYAKFLRKFSGKTQFIIVSHRKPTIELANQIYGITMEEKGVSKLFSVKLSEALRLAKQGDSN